MGRVLTAPVSNAGGGATRTATTSLTANASDIIFIDTATNAAELTITLPANPALGDRVNLIDSAGNCSTIKAIIARNGNKIANVADDLDFDISNNSLELIYSGSSYGWSILSN